ncbi:MAG: hypothetical protein JWO36_6373 [Myxococcales bacterium]|nr:hypothetical protein [Myxococcales bacterium]
MATGWVWFGVELAVVTASRLATAQQAPTQPDTPPPKAQAEAATTPAFPTTVAPPSAAAPAAKVSFTVTPYGLITTAAAYLLGNSSNNPDLPEWAVAGPSTFQYTARETRFGIRGSWVTPPSQFNVRKVDGLIEADFFGGFVGQGLGYVFPFPRLRIATVTAEWCSVRLSFGQDWAVLAPLNPATAFHTAVAGFTTSGNLWARIPQLRLDGIVEFGGEPAHHTWRFIWAGALVASVQADAISAQDSVVATVRTPEGGERSLAPAGEARIALGRDLFGKSLEIGISGHLGNRNIPFATGSTRQFNGAIAADVTLPLPGRLSLEGEAYWGTGLDAFFGGISQGIAHTTDASGAITSVSNSIADAGGWAQVSWAAVDWLTLYAGGGVDKPKRADLVAATAPTNRTLNEAVYGELSVELARGLLFWIEYDFMHTEFQAAPTIQTHVLSLTGQLTF